VAVVLGGAVVVVVMVVVAVVPFGVPACVEVVVAVRLLVTVRLVSSVVVLRIVVVVLVPWAAVVVAMAPIAAPMRRSITLRAISFFVLDVLDCDVCVFDGVMVDGGCTVRHLGHMIPRPTSWAPQLVHTLLGWLTGVSLRGCCWASLVDPLSD